MFFFGALNKQNWCFSFLFKAFSRSVSLSAFFKIWKELAVLIFKRGKLLLRFFGRCCKDFILDGELFVLVDFHLKGALFIEYSDKLGPKILIFLFQIDLSMAWRDVFAWSKRFKAFLAFVSGERSIDRVIALRFLLRVFYGWSFLIDSCKKGFEVVQFDFVLCNCLSMLVLEFSVTLLEQIVLRLKTSVLFLKLI